MGGSLPYTVLVEVFLQQRRRDGLQVPPECYKTFVETGTACGDTVLAMASHFDALYTIELSTTLHASAVAKANSQGVQNVTFIQGDGAERLQELLPKLDDDPVIYFLDAHWSGGVTTKGDVDVPLLQELEAIKTHRRDRGDVIVIDDYRLFGQRCNEDWTAITCKSVADAIGRENMRASCVYDDRLFIFTSIRPDCCTDKQQILTDYLVWVTQPGIGGIGDRVVGIASGLALAELTHRKFLIQWESPDLSHAMTIDPRFDAYAEFSSARGVSDTKTCKPKGPWPRLHESCVNNIGRQEQYWSSIDLTSAWKGYRTVYLLCNQNVLKLLCGNSYLLPHLDASKYVSLRACHLSKAMDEYLCPTKLVTDCVSSVFDQARQELQRRNDRSAVPITDQDVVSVGLQVRLGDHIISQSTAEEASRDLQNDILEMCISHIRTQYPDKKVLLFVCADASSFVGLASKQVCSQDPTMVVFGIDKPVTHIDPYWKHDSTLESQGVEKVLADVHALRRCKHLIISSNSNISRIVASCSSGDVWGLGFHESGPDDYALWSWEGIVKDRIMRKLPGKEILMDKHRPHVFVCGAKPVIVQVPRVNSQCYCGL